MPWRDSNSLPFTHVSIVSNVPSAPGVYGILDGDCCVFIGDSWNLKARLLELASILMEVGHLRIIYELCEDDQRSSRKIQLTNEYLSDRSDRTPPVYQFPGISLSSRSAGS
jgi:hypothetical protein